MKLGMEVDLGLRQIVFAQLRSQSDVPVARYKACGVSLSNAAHASHRARPAAAVRYGTWVN